MTKQTITSLLSIITISLITVGCGGSSSGKKITSTTGTGIDDYIQGAKVCVDVNSDGKLDATVDTPCATTLTNATGQFTFTSDVSASPLVMSGGEDVASKKPFTGTYTAPAGSAVLTPLTTIVQAIITDSNGTISPTDAQTKVKTTLGLPTDVDLITYDPIAQLASSDEATITTAKKVFAKQSSIQTVLTIVSSTIAAVAPESNKTEAEVSNSAALQIAALLTNATTTVDVTTPTNVETIIKETAKKETTTIEPTLVTAVAQTVNVVSTQITADIENSTATNIQTIRENAAQISVVVEDTIVNAIEAVDNGTPVADIVSTLTAIDTATLEASIAEVTIDTTNLDIVATTDTIPTLDESTN